MPRLRNAGVGVVHTAISANDIVIMASKCEVYICISYEICVVCEAHVRQSDNEITLFLIAQMML